MVLTVYYFNQVETSFFLMTWVYAKICLQWLYLWCTKQIWQAKFLLKPLSGFRFNVLTLTYLSHLSLETSLSASEFWFFDKQYHANKHHDGKPSNFPCHLVKRGQMSSRYVLRMVADSSTWKIPFNKLSWITRNIQRFMQVQSILLLFCI